MDSPSKVAAVETEVRKYKNAMFINIGIFHSLFLRVQYCFYAVGDKSCCRKRPRPNDELFIRSDEPNLVS